MAKKAPATKAQDYIKVGQDPRNGKKVNYDGEGESAWLDLVTDQPKTVTLLCGMDDVISCEQCAIWLEEGKSPVWVYTGDDDPYNDLKLQKKRYRAYLPVLEGSDVKVWSMGIMVHTQLLQWAEDGINLVGLNVKIRKTGKGLQTRYSVSNLATRTDVSNVELPNIIPLLGTLDPDEVRTMIAERLGFRTYQEVLDAYQNIDLSKAENLKLARRARNQPKAVATVNAIDPDPVEEDEIEDLELI